MNTLTQWVIDKIRNEYRDDISLLLSVKGHCTDGDGHGEVFDYFIPETERGCSLARTFIIDGVGHDLYPRSWERMENSVTLDEMTMVLSNAEILYARSEKDREKFLDMQKRLCENLADPIFVYRKALERISSALELYRTLAFEERFYRARSEACCIHLYLSQAVAYLNHTFTDSPIFSERQAYVSTEQNSSYHCPQLTAVPDSFFEQAHRILTAKSVCGISEIVHTLIRITRDFVLERKPKTRPGSEGSSQGSDYRALADWYQELSLTFRRIRFFCDQNMPEEAFKDACYLQNELIIIAGDFQIGEMNLVDSFSYDSLDGLKLRSQKLEETIRRILSSHGARINEYASLEEFLAANPAGKSEAVQNNQEDESREIPQCDGNFS